MKKIIQVAGIIGLLVMANSANASTYNVYVENAGDVVSGRDWGYWGSYPWTNSAANPNSVSHSFTPGDGHFTNTSLSFDLSSIAGILSDDISSVTLNYKVLDIWTLDGRDAVAATPFGNILYSNGTGWKNFTITPDRFNDTRIDSTPSLANYTFSYTGYSGLTFGSAEGASPAYLQITTTSIPAPVPLPGAMWLLGSGITGLAATRRRKK
jgi:hypothetical protein